MLFLTAVVQADIDQNTALCFACASSLPPPKTSGLETSSPSASIFTTRCCKRLICPRCIAANPRLERYDPCLACLGGVGVVRSSSTAVSSPTNRTGTARANVDGAVRDEDTFVLGDEDDDDDKFDFEDEKLEAEAIGNVPAPAAHPHGVSPGDRNEMPAEEPATAKSVESPLKYYIIPSDTLQGIVLRYGLDGHDLCRLNNLPPSTLRTTPHLLHTRRFLMLPPSARGIQGPENAETPDEQQEREAHRTREKAIKRLQTLTKEVDWRVAQAYVALAEDPVADPDEEEELARKRKESSIAGPSNLEERAIERYLDDDEWEDQRKRDTEVGPSTNESTYSEKNKGDGRRWWQWGP